MLIINEGLADGVEHVREIPVQAMASFSELLGYADLTEALEAIITEQDTRGDDSPQDAFAEAYHLLTHRERAREDEAAKAKDEGTRDDPRSPRLRAAFAARRAVHEPVDGGPCVMDRCRAEARAKLKVPAPSRNSGAGLRSVAAKTKRRDELAQVVSQVAPQVERLRGEFLHHLTGRNDDPLAEVTAEQVEPVDPVQAIFQKYQGGQP